MKRLLQISLLFCASLCAFAQEQTYTATVIDAETGEPVPYALVYLSEDEKKICNEEGVFSLESDAKKELIISGIGYKKRVVKLRNLGKEVKLQPLSVYMREVVVVPIENILNKVLYEIEKEYPRKYKKKSTYYYKLKLKGQDQEEFIEAFLTGKSNINLRETEYFCGRRFRQARSVKIESFISSTNMQQFVAFSPIPINNPFWTNMKSPFEFQFGKIVFDWETMSYLLHNEKPVSLSRLNVSEYDFRKELLKDDENDNGYVYKITFSPTVAIPKPYVEGCIYISAKNYKILAFEGRLHNYNIDFGRDFHVFSDSIVPHIRITYSHARNFTEVESVVVKMDVGSMQCSSVLMNLNRTRGLPFGKSTPATENLVDALKEAGYNPKVWEKAQMYRTIAEEELVRNGSVDAVEYAPQELVRNDSSFQHFGRFRPLLERLSAFGRTIPQEKVYVHMDNTSYFLGDTIWFSAYTRQTDKKLPSSISGVLYAELLNEDGYLVERKLIEMKEGRGNGNFVVRPDLQYAGFYELRAYTRWQLNWGIHEHPHGNYAKKWFSNREMEENYYRDYDKLYSRVFPIYDPPKEAGAYTRDMTRRVLRRQFKNDIAAAERKLRLSFYPEGGNLVAGVENRVAFEAAWNDGEWVEGYLHVNGDSVPSEHRGRGTFTIVPLSGEEPELLFRTKDGHEVKAFLPPAEKTGVSLQVNHMSDAVRFQLHAKGFLPGDSLALTVMHEGRLEDYALLCSSATEYIFRKDSLGAGVYQLTVFDAEGHVYADRLFFVRNAEVGKSNVTVKGLKDEYTPYERMDLSVEAASPCSFMSLSVKDGNHMDYLYDNGSIYTEMLLASEIKGFIPDPGWYFEADDSLHRRGLDLLLLTQGWRRFVWKDMAVRGEWELSQPDEKTPVVRGWLQDFNLLSDSLIYNYIELETEQMETTQPEPDAASRETLRQSVTPDRRLGRQTILQKRRMKKKMEGEGILVHAELVPLVNPTPLVIEKEAKGRRFQFQLPRFYGKHIFFLDASDTTKWTKGKKYTWVQQTGGDYDSERATPLYLLKKFEVTPVEYGITVEHPYPRFVKPYTYHQKHLRAVTEGRNGAGSVKIGDVTLMSEVFVGARRNMLQRFNDSQPAFILEAEDAENIERDFGMPFIRYFIGDMGLDYPVASATTLITLPDGNFMVIPEPDERIRKRYGSEIYMRLREGLSINPDSIFLNSQLLSFSNSYLRELPEMRQEKYTDDSRLDKYVIYTDYAPRLEGSKRYEGANLPETNIVRYGFYVSTNDMRRVQYRNRRFVLPGFSVCEEFYSPDYSQQTPPDSVKDYRRTLYWNPNLMLDENGKAMVTLYNCSRTTRPVVTTAGQAADGTLLWNE